MWSDNETERDLIGFSVHAELLKSILMDDKMLPVTIGLFGDWGGGKSSILKMLQKELESDPAVAVVYFNGWVFEGYEDAKSAILTELLRGLRDHRDLKSIVGDEIRGLLRRVDLLKLAKMGMSAGLAILAPHAALPVVLGGAILGGHGGSADGEPEGVLRDASTEGMGLLKAAEESTENVRGFRDEFEELIGKTRLKALVVLIDDLDRCSPERVIENLEAIKLFLNVGRTAFVIAADPRVVENAIRVRYWKQVSQEAETSIRTSLVEDYLEKLIQIPYTLPKLAPHEVRSYLTMLFLEKYLPKANFDQAVEKYREFQSSERYTSFRIGDELDSLPEVEVRAALLDSLRLVEACSDAITDGLKGNPRQIKRFLNAFWLRRELGKLAGISDLQEHVLIKLMVLEYMNKDCFAELYQWHRASPDGTALPMLELETARAASEIVDDHPKWGATRVWRWVKADPSLAGVDLRDYYWVARSGLTETLAGVRLMTPAMNTCVEELVSTVEVERKMGVKLFTALSEDEQVGVLGMVSRHSMQHIKDDAGLRSLLDLAAADYVSAAEAFEKCVDGIGDQRLTPGFGVSLRAFKVRGESKACEMVERVRSRLAKTDSKIGSALRAKKTGKR